VIDKTRKQLVTSNMDALAQQSAKEKFSGVIMQDCSKVVAVE